MEVHANTPAAAVSFGQPPLPTHSHTHSQGPRAVLEQHKADVVTTLFIPIFNNDHFPNFPEIMYKTDFRDILRPLRPKKRQALLTSLDAPGEVPDPLSLGLGDKGHPSHLHGGRSSHCSNIIDLLEKKYCGGHGMLDPGYEEREDSAWGDSPAPSTGTSPGLGLHDGTGGSLEPKKKRKKRKKGANELGDYYDADDGFIDDSENITEIQAQISGKYLQTKHSGFFINTGQLEVLEGSDDHMFTAGAKEKKKNKGNEGAGNIKASGQKVGMIPGTITPYHMFSKANKAYVREANPEECMEKGGMNKLLGVMWKGLDAAAKEVYVASAAAAMKEKERSQSHHSESKSTSESQVKEGEDDGMRAAGSKKKKKKKSSSLNETADCKVPGQKGGIVPGTITPYHMFSKANKASVREANPEAYMEKGGMNKLLGVMWKGLDAAAKEVYVASAAAAMKEKEKKRAEGNSETEKGKSACSGVKDTGDARSGFRLFSRVKRESIRETDPTVCAEQGGFAKLVGALWKSVGDEEKKLYCDMATAGKTLVAKVVPPANMSPYDFFCFTQRSDPQSSKIDVVENGSNQDFISLWTKLTDDDKMVWGDLADANNKRMKDMPPPAVTLTGLELFHAVNMLQSGDGGSASNSNESIDNLWNDSSTDQKFWEMIASTVGAIATDLMKKMKKRSAESNATDETGGVAGKNSKKKLKKAEGNDEGTANATSGDLKKKKKKKTAPTIPDDLSELNPNIPLTEGGAPVKKKIKKASTTTTDVETLTRPFWSQPPPTIVSAMLQLQHVVEKEVLLQAQADENKAKKKTKNSIEIPESVSAPQTLKKITDNVQEELQLLDDLARSLNMPGTEPLMTAPKRSTKTSAGGNVLGSPTSQGVNESQVRFVGPPSTPADDTILSQEAEKTTSIDNVPTTLTRKDEEPTYLDVLHGIINHPNGSGISPNQIRSAILKHRCRELIKRLKKDLNHQIPVLCDAIRAKIVPNEKYDPAAIVASEVDNKDDAEATTLTDDKDDVKEKKVKVAAPALPYICKWDQKLKSDLFNVIDLAAQWVDAENEYRQKYLTAQEKKSLGSQEVDFLDFGVEKNIVLNRIISEVFVAPYICDVCEKSDITTMRQFYSKEKKRVEKGK